MKKNVFDEMASFKREEQTISTTKALLERIHMTCNNVHGHPADVDQIPSVSISVFLTSYMMTATPAQVFEDESKVMVFQLEKQPFQLVECFETFVNQLKWLINRKGITTATSATEALCATRCL